MGLGVGVNTRTQTQIPGKSRVRVYGFVDPMMIFTNLFLIIYISDIVQIYLSDQSSEDPKIFKFLNFMPIPYN